MALINPLAAFQIEQCATTDKMIDENGINWRVLGFIRLTNDATIRTTALLLSETNVQTFQVQQSLRHMSRLS
jgi:hypothetical protein